jgi:hypothetical protein
VSSDTPATRTLTDADLRGRLEAARARLPYLAREVVAGLHAEVDRLHAEVAKAEQRGAEKARAELADRYVEQLRRQEDVHDSCEGHALCDLVSELTRTAVAES